MVAKRMKRVEPSRRQFSFIKCRSMKCVVALSLQRRFIMRTLEQAMSSEVGREALL